MTEISGSVEWTAKFHKIKSGMPDVPYTSLVGFVESEIRKSEINYFMERQKEERDKTIYRLTLHGGFFLRRVVYAAELSFVDSDKTTFFKIDGDEQIVKKAGTLLKKYLEKMKVQEMV